LTDGALALRDLSAALVATPRAHLAWLALTALTGAYPTADQVRSLTRTARLNPEREVSWAAM
ncbi:MAG TPA: hypothetical protein PKB06_07525, partial [Actinotalea sp.]|nr:hypothetical protein [Actinotalea sp.]